MKNYKFLVVTHVALREKTDIAGPSHTIVSYLEKQGQPFLFIRHAIENSGPTFIGESLEIKKSRIIKFSLKNEILKRIFEGILTIRAVLNQKGNLIYIGIDPLNSLWGVILKKIGRVSKLIIYTPDYSDKRYVNRFLNFLYFFIDRLTLQNSDLIAAVSERIIDLRKQQGIDATKLFLLSNAPGLKEIKSIRKKSPNASKIIMVNTLIKKSDLYLPLLVIKKLIKKFPNLCLTIVGSGPEEVFLRQKIKELGLSTCVKLLKGMSHFKLFMEIAKHGVGLALYDSSDSWRYYSDSMKARDYLALGLPVIISGDLWTVGEIEKFQAGVVIKFTQKDLEKTISRLLSDKKTYQTYHKNALKLASLRDNDLVMKKLYNLILGI